MSKRFLPLCLAALSLGACETMDDPLARYEAMPEEERRLADNALMGVDVAEGLEVTLFAAEPLLANPTNIDVDHRGRVWVCEGVNYRPTLNPQNPTPEENDRILILEDTDQDGVLDSRKVFYQGADVNAALGIMVMGNRVIVSSSPNVFVFTDEDGDDQADTKEVLFSGIGGEQHDHAVHAFVFGPDGRLYFNFGNAGGQLLDADGRPIMDMHGRPVVDDGAPYREGMVFRMNQDGSDFEVLGHNFRNNYEVAIDSYGTLWQSDNDDDGNQGVRINFVMEYGNYGFKDEMTGADWRVRRTGMSDEIPLRHWHLNDPGVVPNLLQTGAGSPTGILVYEGRFLPAVFHDQMIHTDAGPNVVRAYPVREQGAGYTAEIVNILKGRDAWFRPSDVAVAPDGSIIVADWYDPGVGGHQMGDMQRGRLFRVAPPDAPYTTPDIDLATPEGAVEALTSPNHETRTLAWQALNEMGAQAEPALLRLWEDSNNRMRARALWLLAAIEGKTADYVEQGLSEANADLRITALRIARRHKMDLVPILERVVEDASPQVRREAAVAIRYLDHPRAAELWTALALQHTGDDRWYLEALGIGAEPRWEPFFEAWRAEVGDDWKSGGGKDIVWRARTAAAKPMLAELILDPSVDSRERARYFRAYDFNDPAGNDAILASLLDASSPDQEEITILALQHLAPRDGALTAQARQALDTVIESVAGTRPYLDLVERFEMDEQAPTLFEMALAHPDSALGIDAAVLLLQLEGAERFQEAIRSADADVQNTVLTVLGRVGSNAAKDALQPIVDDSTQALALRMRALEAFGRGWNGENRLLALVRDGDLPPELHETAASILFNSYRQGIRDEAAAYLEPPVVANEEPLPPVRELVDLEGDAGHGHEVYATLCSTCHVVGGEGTDFGPNLSGIGEKLSREGLYNAILLPNAGISFGYEGYRLSLQDGSEVVGYIASETDDEVQLRVPGGVTNRYATGDIVSRTALTESLMPSLRAGLTRQDLVDLVAYLETLTPAEM